MDMKKTLEDVISLKERVENTSEGYFNSAHLSQAFTPFNEKVFMDIFDWGLIGAISESPILLTGDTDRGKTDYAKILMTSLFGEEGWHKTDVDIDFGSNTYSENDFSALTEGKTSEELFYGKEWLKLPGLIWDEPNRAPAKLLNKLLHILEKEFTLENGKKIRSGYQNDDKLYQFNILAMNEGDDFKGTNEVDRALRRRQTIEIPVDTFQSTMHDKLMMNRQRFGELDIKNGDSTIDTILQLNTSLKEIPISPSAEHLKLYLQSMGRCDKSITGDKWGVDFSEAICEKAINHSGQNGNYSCHYRGSYPNNMCPNVYGLTDGVGIKIGNVARAHALLRATKVIGAAVSKLGIADNDDYKKMAAQAKINSEFLKKISDYLSYQEENGKRQEMLVREFARKFSNKLEVEAQDVRAVLPFVAYSKFRVNPHWVKRTYQGSKWEAVKDITDLAYGKIQELHSTHPEISDSIARGVLTSSNLEFINEEYEDDLWMKASIEAYQPNGHYGVSAEKVKQYIL